MCVLTVKSVGAWLCAARGSRGRPASTSRCAPVSSGFLSGSGMSLWQSKLRNTPETSTACNTTDTSECGLGAVLGLLTGLWRSLPSWGKCIEGSGRTCEAASQRAVCFGTKVAKEINNFLFFFLTLN